MRKIKILLLLFIFPAAGFTQKTVTAVSIIASVNKNEPVNLTDAQVTGDLDFTRLANMKAESQNSSEKVYISTVNSAISFNNCSFTGKVLGYFNPDNGKPFSRDVPLLTSRPWTSKSTSRVGRQKRI